METKDRKYYERLFTAYPDVVDLQTLRKMLGDISESFVRDKLQKGIITSFKIDGKVFMTPKVYIIDYVLSDAYQNCKHMLKNQV